MKNENVKKGKEGEEMACKYLKSRGYKIITRNYRTKSGEIDIIASKKNTLVFVEVKLRYGEMFGDGFDAVNESKIKKLRKTAEFYLYNNKIENMDIRFDVISIDFTNKKYRIEHLKGAF